MTLEKFRLRLALKLNELLQRSQTSLDRGALAQPLQLDQLEDRILLSASPAAVIEQAHAASDQPNSIAQAAQASSAQDSMPSAAESLFDALAIEIDSASPRHLQSFANSDSELGTAASSLTEPIEPALSEAVPRRELVFVDTGIDGFTALLDELWSENKPEREIAVALISTQSDGIDQIGQVLADERDLDAIHFVASGNEQSIRLGSSWLTSENIARYALQLGSWADSLSPGAGVHFYGADFASNESGRTLLSAIQILTGVDHTTSNSEFGIAAIQPGQTGQRSLETTIGEGSISMPTGFQELTLESDITIAGRKLVLNSSSTSGSEIIVEAGGILGGSGSTTGPVNARSGGIVAPGNSPGRLSTGDFELAPGSSLAIEINGKTAATEHDQVDVTGAVTLAGSLKLIGGYAYSETDEITIIQNDGVDAINGTFSGLAEGDHVQVGDFSGFITYVGGDGNDVVLLANDNPFLAVTGQNSIFTESGGAIFVEPILGVTDADSPNFDGATLTAAISSNATSADQLFIHDQGTAVGEVGVSGSNITYNFGTGAVNIGAFKGGTNGSTPLVVLFNASADATAVQAVGRNLQYKNQNVDPSTLTRQVQISLTDGDLGLSNTASKPILVEGDHRLVVTTTSDQIDGTVTSIDSLLADKGADGAISLREAITALNNTANIDGMTPDAIHFDLPLGDAGHVYYQEDSAGGFSTPVATTLDAGSISDFDGDYPSGLNSGAPFTFWRFSVTGALPTITDPVIIDATTQPGYTNHPLLELRGDGSLVDGFKITASNSTIRGFAVNNFGEDGVSIRGSGGNTIQANYIGTLITGVSAVENGASIALGDDGIDVRSAGNAIGGTTANVGNLISGATDNGVIISTGGDNTLVAGNLIGTTFNGSAALPNGDDGIQVSGGVVDVTIGGLTDNDRNVISGNVGDGIHVGDAGTDGTTIIGNYIGVSADGLHAIGNSDDGVDVTNDATHTTIGSASSGGRKIISGNLDHGIVISDFNTTATRVTGNYIGVDATGSGDLGNAGDGVSIGPNSSGNFVGGNSVDQANTIAFNAGNGITVRDANHGGNEIRINTIFANGGLALDLGDDGVTLNSNTDPWQNMPTLSSAVFDSNTLTIQGSLSTTPFSSVTFDFYANESSDNSGFGEAASYLGSATQSASLVGQINFNESFSASIPDGAVVTVIGTGPDNFTSEFSQNIAVEFHPILDLDSDNSGGVSGRDFATTWTQSDGATPIADTDATLADGDSATLSSLSVSISNRQDGADEVLSAEATGTNLTVLSGPGSLVISGPDSLANYQTVLRSISYNNTAASPSLGSRVIRFVANDGSHTSNIATTTLSLVAGGASPSIDLDGDNSSGESTPNFSTSWTEGGGPVAVTDADSILADTDSATLSSLTVQLTNLLDGTNESLAANTSGTSISASYSGGSGTLSLTGVDSLANYQSVLRSITYDNTSTNPDTANRVITLAASDGTNISPTATSTIRITSINNAPTITSLGGQAAASSNIAENATILTTITSSDPDGGTPSYSITDGPDASAFIINSSTGVIEFAASPDFEDPADADLDNVYEFTITASDGNGGSDTQDISITVTGTNDNDPIIDGGSPTDTISVTENNTVVKTVSATDGDLPVQTLTYAIIGGNDGALFSINSSTGELTFGSGPDFENPADSDANNIYHVSVEVGDGNGRTDTQDITVNVGATNDNDPVINSDGGLATAALTVAEGQTSVTTIAASDDDQPTQTMTYSISGGADASRFSLNAVTGVLQFQTAPDFEDALDTDGDNVYEVLVEASDGAGRFDTQALAIAVSNINENPLLDLDLDDSNGTLGEDFSATFTEDQAPAPISDPVDATLQDIDGSQISTLVARITNPQDGIAESLDADTSGTSITKSFDNSTGILTLSGNDSVASYQQVLRTLTYSNTSDTPATTKRTVEITVTDDGLADSNTVVATVAVTENDDSPTLTANNLAVTENQTATVSNTEFAATDVDSAENSLRFEISNLSGGQFALAASPTVAISSFTQQQLIDSDIVFVDDGDEISPQFDVAVTDGTTSTSPTPAAISFIQSNDPPTSVGGSITTNEDTEFAFAISDFNHSDDDGDALVKIRIESLPTNGALTLSGDPINNGDLITAANISSSQFVYSPNADFNGDAGDSFEYSVHDGVTFATTAAVMTINVQSVNDLPVLVASTTYQIDENQIAIATLDASDIETPSDSLAYSLTGGNDAGRFSINSTTGELVFEIAPDFEAPSDNHGDNRYEVEVTVTDGDGGSRSQSLLVEVLDVDEFDITAISDGDSNINQVDENAPPGSPTGVAAFAADVDGSATIIYELIDDADGRFTIDPQNGEVTTLVPLDAETATSHNISVRASSSDGSAATRDFNIFLNDVDEFDAGVILDSDGDTDAVAENSAIGTPVGIIAVSDDLDVSDTVTFSLDDDASGTLSIAPDSGEVRVSAPIDFESANNLPITVRATSTDGSVSIQPFSIAVVDVNDNAPVITQNQVFSISEFATASTVVGTVNATDLDTDTTLSNWTIVGGNDSEVFLLDPDSGELSISDSTSLNFESTPSFTLAILVSDGANLSGTETIQIDVSDENDLPVLIANSPFTLDEGSTATIGDTTLLTTDEDDLPVDLRYTVSRSPTAGHLELTSQPGVAITSFTQDDINTGQLVYVHNGSEADDEFQFTISDAKGGLVATATQSILVTRINDTPAIDGPALATTLEDTPLVFSTGRANAIAISDADAFGGTIGVRLVATNGTIALGELTGVTIAVGTGSGDTEIVFGGTISNVNSALENLTFTPDNNFFGTATLQIEARDLAQSGGGGEQMATTLVPIDVVSINDAPRAEEDSYSLTATQTLVVDSQSGLLSNDSDTENDPLQVILVTAPQHGTLTLNPDGSFTYMPQAGFFGTDEFQYTVADGASQGSSTKVVLDIGQFVTTATRNTNTSAATSVSDVADSKTTDSSEAEPETDTTEDSSSGNDTTEMKSLPVSTLSSDNEDDEDDVNVIAALIANASDEVESTETASEDSYFLIVADVSATASRSHLELIESAADSEVHSISVSPSLGPSATLETMSDAEFIGVLEQAGLWDELETFKQSVSQSKKIEEAELELVVETTAITTSALTVGYVVWLLRSGTVVFSLISSLPAWTMIDPLPILAKTAAGNTDDDAGDDSLQTLLSPV